MKSVALGPVTLYLGDAAEVLPTLPNVDLLATDPPYGMAYESGWRDKPKFEMIQGDQGEIDVTRILDLAVSRLHPKRHAYIFGPKEPVLACEKLTGHTELIWAKDRMGMGDLAAPWGPAHEPIHFAVFVSSVKERAQGRGGLLARMRKGSVLSVSRPDGNKTRHPNEKPVALMRQLIESSTVVGDCVLDPFMGSGSTIVAALLSGRSAIGIEIDPQHFETAKARVERLLPLLESLEAA